MTGRRTEDGETVMRILLMQTKGRKVDSIAQLNNNNGGFVQHIKVVASRWPEVAPNKAKP